MLDQSGKTNNKNSSMQTPLEEYLEYYKKLEAPGYAVLVTGDWGVGKTYQVRKYLSEGEHCYVSLFGLTLTDEVHASVLAETDPGLTKVRKVVSGIGKAAETAGGISALAGNIAPVIINTALRREIKPDKLLVFDDLERSHLKLKNLLGVINTYVEQYEFRAVVIAHDDKLKKKFKNLKEKLFGQTIQITPQVDKAFVKFVSGTKNPNLEKFVNGHKDSIIRVFNESGAMSLRVLRHVIEDLGRLHGALSDKHLDNAGAMTKLVCLFCALNIEIRAGYLEEKDLKDRQTLVLMFQIQQHDSQDNLPEPPLIKSNKKYPSVEFDDSNLLNDRILIQMLIEGRYQKDEIRDSLNNSSYFQKPEDAPPWNIIWNLRHYDDATLKTAAENMQGQFDNREVTEPGEMLHIFSLRMRMSEEGILPEGHDKIVDSCKAYIDDLLEAGKLPPPYLKEQQEYSYGCGFSVMDTYKDQFQEIQDYLSEMRMKALERQYPDIAAALLKLVRTDGQQFFEQVGHTNNGENPYVSIPVLSYIDPSEFVGAWLGGSPENWQMISRALEGRYTSDTGRLASEHPWADKVLKLLISEADKSGGFRSLRIRRAIPQVLRSLVAEEDKSAD